MCSVIALPRLNVLGRLMTPIFSSFLMDHFLYQFSTFREKNEQNLSTRNLTVLQNIPSSFVLLSSLFICVTVSNASCMVRFYESVGNI